MTVLQARFKIDPGQAFTAPVRLAPEPLCLWLLAGTFVDVPRQVLAGAGFRLRCFLQVEHTRGAEVIPAFPAGTPVDGAMKRTAKRNPGRMA